MIALIKMMLMQLAVNGVQQLKPSHGWGMHFMAKALDQFTLMVPTVHLTLTHFSYVLYGLLMIVLMLKMLVFLVQLSVSLRVYMCPFATCVSMCVWRWVCMEVGVCDVDRYPCMHVHVFY